MNQDTEQCSYIDRSGTLPVLTYSRPSSSSNDDAPTSTTSTCSSVVLAFPPVLSALTPPTGINISLTLAERAVFTLVQISPYWSWAADAPGVPYKVVAQQDPFVPKGEPVTMLRLFEESGVATGWSWGPGNGTGGLSTEEVTNLARSTIAEVQEGFSTLNVSSQSSASKPDTNSDPVKELRKWDYFPHFGLAELASGLYEKYNALQGNQKTYYSSGLNGFETVEFAIRAAKELAETFF